MTRYIQPDQPVHSRTMQRMELDPDKVEATRKISGDVAVAFWQSRDFYATLYVDSGSPYPRLTVHRTETDRQTGTWRDGITWDELQAVKRQCGMAEQWALEVYPADSEIVGMKAVRHLWFVKEAPDFAWVEAKERARRGLDPDGAEPKSLDQPALR